MLRQPAVARPERVLKFSVKLLMFELRLTGGPDGRIRAAYVNLGNAGVARTKGIVDDTLLADYDARGRLVGIEILAPVKMQVLIRLIDKEHRAAFRRFAKESIPERLLDLAA